ncbi:MAG: thioredoxin domain-containing protein [Patescibacteria group bacterium]
MDEPNQNLTKRERRELRRQEKTERREQQGSKQRRNKILLWSIIGVAGALVIFGIFWLGSKSAAKTPKLPLDAVAGGDWVRGKNDSKVVLIEYSDFQCPACSARYPFVKQAESEFNDRVAFVFRHFPLPMHPNAKPAAWAAEAAGKQGKFWEMHDLLFEKQAEWSGLDDPANTFAQYAESLSLDKTQFQSDYSSDTVKKIVSDAVLAGERIPIEGTPTYYLGGKMLQPFSTYEQLKQSLQDAVDKNKP